MKQAEDKPRWFFVDEAGDPAFYAKGKKLIVGNDGCSRTFSVGFLRTYDPQAIRAKLTEVRLEIMNDKYFKAIPSIAKTLRAFHAKDDVPEVRKLVYAALDKMDFGFQVIVGRKHVQLFTQRHKESQDLFYDDLVSHLFSRQLHLATENTIIFARRGDKARQHALRAAVERGTEEFRKKYKTAATTKVHIETSQPAQDAVLQATDYVLWSVQRAFERGEMRYFDYMREKIELVWDVYDFRKLKEIKKGGTKGSVVYDRKNNPFDIKKASPLS
jgi:hypothetical protein